jgi:superfamily I DNA/RNA helicase
MAISLNEKYALNERYRAVVEHKKGKLIVSAGPGTGKTFSLLRRIESLIDNNVDPSQIYYLTFANSIVDAFKADVCKPKEKQGLGVDADALGINILTLHGLAFKIIKVYSDELELPSYLETIDLSPRSKSVLSKIFINDLLKYSKSQGIIRDKKDFDQSLYQITETWRLNKSIGRNDLEQVIMLFCKKYSVCPWDRLVPLAIKGLLENGLPKWLQGTQHFMIDEYQDFNPSEQKLIKLITENSDSLVIVGDPDQSIYSSRSASPKGLTDLFAQDDVEYVNFVDCRRCPKKVIIAANNMLKFMDPLGYKEKKLHPFKKIDGGFTIIQYKSCKEEVKKIVNFVNNFKMPDRTNLIVLFPEGKVAKYYVEKFRKAGISCNIKEMDIDKELLSSIMRLTILHSHPFLERVVLSFFPKMQRKYISDVLPKFINNNSRFVNNLSETAVNQNWQKGLKDSLSFFKSVITNLISDDINLIKKGFAELNLKANPSPATINSLLANDEMLSVIKRVELSINEGGQDIKEDASSIGVMTMHSSKGLSKKIVIIPAFDEKLLPGNEGGKRFLEKHRLVYVAITRAENQVVITFPATRDKYDSSLRGAKPSLSRYAKILSSH